MAQELPLDVLEVVFGHCWDAKDYSKWSTMDPWGIPMLFLRVCASWRKAALSSPRIWSELSVTFDEESVEELACMTIENSSPLETWFRLRGQRGPRRLRLVFDCDLETPLGFKLPATWHEHLQHFELISKGSNGPEILDILTPISQFPSLTTLVVWSSKLGDRSEGRLEDDLSSNTDDHLDPSQIYAQLRRLWVRNYEPTRRLGRGARETWSRLTHLVVEYPLKEIAFFLTACPQLEEAVFFFAPASHIGGAEVNQAAAVTSHFALNKLTIFLQRGHNDGERHLTRLFRGWQLPALEYLQLSCGKGLLDPPTWNRILRRTPALKELYVGPLISIHPSNTGQTVLHSLNQWTPFLDTLILDHSQARTRVFRAEEIRHFLATRRDSRSLSTVKNLVLVFPNKHISQPTTYHDEPLDSDFLDEELQEFVEEGLELVVKRTELPHRMVLWPNFMHRGGRWRESDRRLWLEHYSTYRAFI